MIDIPLPTYPMKLISLACLMLITVQYSNGQPYHNDTTVLGVQTLGVEGDLAVEQYGSGAGGNLKVTGDAHLGAGGISLPSMPSGVTGTYYGTQKLGTQQNVGEFVFEKTGDSTSGDFIVPLGRFGEWEGTAIQLDVQTGPFDADSGSAHFMLMSKRHRGNGDITALRHSAFGSGRGIKIYGLNTHGITYLYLEFDANSGGNENAIHRVIVRANCIGKMEPENRALGSEFSFMTPIRLAESISSDAIFGDSLTHTLNADNIVLNGNVTMPAGRSLTLTGGDLEVGGSVFVSGSKLATESYSSSTAMAAINSKFSGSLAMAGGTAYGATTVAMTGGTTYGDSTVAMGDGYASGSKSVAMTGGMSFGTSSTAISGGYSWGDRSTAMAGGSAFGEYSVALSGSAQGDYSFAAGWGSAEGVGSIAFGGGSYGDYSVAIGQQNFAYAYKSIVVGPGGIADGSPTDWSETDTVFAVGNSPFVETEYPPIYGMSNAITTLKNGQTSLTNKFWDAAVPTAAPITSDGSSGNALIVEGHTILEGNSRFKGNTVMEGQVTIMQVQGDISMGIYQ